MSERSFMEIVHSFKNGDAIYWCGSGNDHLDEMAFIYAAILHSKRLPVEIFIRTSPVRPLVEYTRRIVESVGIHKDVRMKYSNALIEVEDFLELVEKQISEDVSSGLQKAYYLGGTELIFDADGLDQAFLLSLWAEDRAKMYGVPISLMSNTLPPWAYMFYSWVVEIRDMTDVDGTVRYLISSADRGWNAFERTCRADMATKNIEAI